MQLLSAFPRGCDSDTIVVTLIDFVKVHRALLEILIRRARFAVRDENLEVEDAEGGGPMTADAAGAEHLGFWFIRPLIASILRAIETVWEILAYDLIALLPTRQKCLRLQWVGLDATLRRAIAAYEGGGIE